jgi:hypothetical protein
MDDETLLNDLIGRCASTIPHATWEELAPLMNGLERIGRSGSTALVKVDGARQDGAVYTVVISGGRLGESFFRKDGDDLAVLLHEAIAFYLANTTGGA